MQREILGRLTRISLVPLSRVFNALLPHLSDLPVKCGGRSSFGPKVVRNLVSALVSQIEIAFRDQKEVEKSPERTFQTRRFLSPTCALVTIATLNMNIVFFPVRRERQVTVI